MQLLSLRCFGGWEDEFRINPTSGDTVPEDLSEDGDELCSPRRRRDFARQEERRQWVPLRRVPGREPRQVDDDDLLQLPPDEVVAVEVRDADEAPDDGAEGRPEGILHG